MLREEIKRELELVFRKIFDDDSINIFDEMTAKDVRDWDSLNHINLIVAVEQRFHIALTVREATAMKNVGEFIALIQKKKAPSGAP
jgi:acyl carrier protein